MPHRSISQVSQGPYLLIPKILLNLNSWFTHHHFRFMKWRTSSRYFVRIHSFVWIEYISKCAQWWNAQYTL